MILLPILAVLGLWMLVDWLEAPKVNEPPPSKGERLYVAILAAIWIGSLIVQAITG